MWLRGWHDWSVEGPSTCDQFSPVQQVKSVKNAQPKVEKLTRSLMTFLYSMAPKSCTPRTDLTERDRNVRIQSISRRECAPPRALACDGTRHTAMQTLRIQLLGISGWRRAHAAVSRLSPISLSRIVARTEGYTYAAKVWALTVVQGRFSVALCETLALWLATFSSLYGMGRWHARAVLVRGYRDFNRVFDRIGRTT
jgi:hypothetical protein